MKNFLMFPFVIRVGLACVFLTNSIMAFVEPSEFQDLISGSFFASILPVSVATFVTFIGVNDFIVAALLFLGWRTSYVATYATAWMVGVIAVIGAVTLDALEHLGFLSMALALAVRKEFSK